MPVPENVIRANIRATVGANEEMVHTLHFRRVNTTTEPEPTLQEIADKIGNAWLNMLNAPFASGFIWRSRMSTAVNYSTVDTYALDAAGKATGQAQYVFGANVNGTNTNPQLPPEVALVASLRTGLPGRSKRGRLYLGGFTVSDVVVGGTVQGSLRVHLATALADFGSVMKFPIGAGIDRLNWSVLSRTLTQTNRIEEVRVGSLWDVQRRRQNGMIETFSSEDIGY